PTRVGPAQIHAQDRLIDLRRSPLIARDHRALPLGCPPFRAEPPARDRERRRPHTRRQRARARPVPVALARGAHPIGSPGPPGRPAPPPRPRPPPTPPPSPSPSSPSIVSRPRCRMTASSAVAPSVALVFLLSCVTRHPPAPAAKRAQLLV